MSQILYCITHETYGEAEVESIKEQKCLWTSCPPPELPEGWEQSVEPPTPDEMELIDQNATELALDLESAW